MDSFSEAYRSPTDSVNRHARVRLLAGPTPIQRLLRVEAALGAALDGTRLFAKRDDSALLGGGGSKLRKLEFLLGEALSQGADTIIATGARQSNSARLTAAAAAHLGLRCELFLRPLAEGDDTDYARNGNLLLDELFGAKIHAIAEPAAAGSFLAERQAALEAEGRVVYVLPPGASSDRASLGYAECAFEIASQERAMGIRFDRVVVANGSAGTQAGLVAGFALLGRHELVHGFSVLAEAAVAHENTASFARAAYSMLGGHGDLRVGDVIVTDGFRGPGYGRVTRAAVDAVRFLATHEGLLLDPVYSAKAFAGLLSQARHGEFASNENVLFVMTGGTPALFAYRKALSDTPPTPPPAANSPWASANPGST